MSRHHAFGDTKTANIAKNHNNVAQNINISIGVGDVEFSNVSAFNKSN